VPNLRDLSSALTSPTLGADRLPPARLFRCGAPWGATNASTNGVLVGVATFIDLRTPAERVEERTAVPTAYLPAVFLGAAADNGGAAAGSGVAAGNGAGVAVKAAKVFCTATAAVGATAAAPAAPRPPPPPTKVISGCGTRTWVHAPILSHLGTAWALLSPLPLSTSLPILAKAAVGHPAGRAGVVDLMDRGGLTGLNAMLVHYGGAGISSALRAIANAALPVALFCTAGKDRTGIVSAVVLAVCGATDAEIVADYAASEAVYVRGEGDEGGGVRAWYSGRLTQVGLGAPEWKRAGPEVMVRTLEMMRQRSGTIEAYLEESGKCRWNGRRSVGRGGEMVEHMEVGAGEGVCGPALLCLCERGVGPLLRWRAGEDAEEREQWMKDGFVHMCGRFLRVGTAGEPRLCSCV